MVVHPVPGRAPSDPAWGALLRERREAGGLSRAALAARAGVSAESLRGYETGRRRPSRETLRAILGSLGTDPATANEILRRAGFAPDITVVGRHADRPEHSLSEAIEVIDALTWPAHVNTETFEVLAANGPAQATWAVDFATELQDPLDRNMIAVLCTPRFADRIANWDEVMALCVAMLKGAYGDGLLAPASPNPYMARVLERLLAGKARYVHRLLRIWDSTRPGIQKWRFSFPIVWRGPDGTSMRFLVVVNPVNLSDYMTISEWIPLDSTTWEALDSSMAARGGAT